MTHLKFYLQHSLNDLRRNGRRTLFALFCVGVGVAAIVALRMLGLSIGETLVRNIAATNKGDIKLTANGRTGTSQATNDSRNAFSEQTLQQIKAWAEKEGAQVTSAIANVNIQLAALDGTNAGRLQIITSLVIDPKVYPFYADAIAVDPPGVPMSKLFTGGNDVIISENLAKAQNIKVGDQVRVGRTEKPFTVRGIVASDLEGFRSITVLFFGFAYFDQASASTLQLEARPDEIYIKLPPGVDANQKLDELRQAVSFDGRTQTVKKLLEQNKQTADVVDRFIVAMGLIALLIGATGIIHTMLVVVRRRTLEIAVLKTIGLRGGQITVLFMVEALIMGIVGSLIGIVMGIVLSLGANAFTQQIWPTTLQWRIYPEALGTGILLGVVVTFVFGFLPVLTAARVRPASVLRPNEAHLPPMGCFYSGLALLIIVGGVGLIVGGLFNSILFGMISVTLTLILMGVIISILWFIVLLISGIPPFRSVNLRLALRGIGEHRFRTATTLFALTAGMFALSSITLISSSVPKLLNLSFQNALGGNVLVFTPIQLLRPLVNTQLNTLEGVEHYSQISFYTGDLVALNGDTDWASKIKLPGPLAGMGEFNNRDFADASFAALAGQDVRAKGYVGPKVIQGRTLTPADAGKAVMLVRDSDITRQLAIKPGDQIEYGFGRVRRTYEVIGILQESSGFTISTDILAGTMAIPVDAVPAGVSASIEFTVAQINDKGLNNALVSLTAIPGVFGIDIGFIDSLIRKLINQFTVIPTIVALLSLFAGAVIIANTVSLATLERRQRIGVLKAIGMTGRRTLWIMILENGIVGVVGGLIGVGIGIFGVWLFSLGSGLSIFQSVDWGYVVLLMILSIGITLVATALSAGTAVGEKPLNVLRYE
jgi:ABC-type antimicrobial peptide transport system permease subunit